MYDKLMSNDRTGCIIASIRSGKTGAALRYLEDKGFKSILWIAFDSDERDRHLKKECEEWGLSDLYNRMTVTLPHSLHKLVDNHYEIILWNEMQTINGSYYNTLKNFIQFDILIGMTGTYPNNTDKASLLSYLGLSRVIHAYSTDKAVKDKNVAPYKITVLELPLSTEKNIKVEYKDKTTGKLKHFMTSELKQYNYTKKQKNATLNQKRRAMLSFAEVRQLSTLESKLKFVRNFLYKYREKRYLVFAQDHESSQKISKYIYNSHTDDTYFKKFLNEEIPHLVLLNKASTGTTYENLDGCVLLAVNSSNVDVLQRILRSILYRDNYTANIIILISKDTIQEKWIKKALADLDQSKITFKELIRNKM